MLNMIVIDGNFTPFNATNLARIDGTITNSVVMWRCSRLCCSFSKSKWNNNGISTTSSSGTKRKYELISERLNVDVQKRDAFIVKLMHKKAKLEIQLEQVYVQLKLCQQRKGQPVRYADIYTGGNWCNNALCFFTLSKRMTHFLIQSTLQMGMVVLFLWVMGSLEHHCWCQWWTQSTNTLFVRNNTNTKV